MTSLRWGVLGCIPLPHRAEKSSDREEEPLSQAVRTQGSSHRSCKGLPGRRASFQDSRNPVERAGAYLCAHWATCPSVDFSRQVP